MPGHRTNLTITLSSTKKEERITYKTGEISTSFELFQEPGNGESEDKKNE